MQNHSVIEHFPLLRHSFGQAIFGKDLAEVHLNYLVSVCTAVVKA
jgi:hypothetical protein